MKLLKYILLFLFSLLLNRNISATKTVVVENQNVFFNHFDGATQTVSKEGTWLGLLYLQESSKLVISNTETALSYSQSFSLVNPELIDSWKVISHRSSVLRRNTDALEAIDNIKTNSKYSDFGLDDNLLGQLKGWGYGVDNGASFAEVITDLDRLLTNCGNNSINITNFNQITNVLKANNTANTKGMHWIIQDLAGDVTTFNNKTITLEFSVPNARPNPYNSSIDVYCSDCFSGGKRLLVEYKYGPTSITKDKILTQFIERDLFNPDIISINQIQWRLKETGLTKTQLNTWLNTTECKTAIQNLGKNKIAALLNDNTIQQMTKSQAATKLIDHLNVDANYNLIFK